MKKTDLLFLLIAVLLIFAGGVASVISGRSSQVPPSFENNTVKVGAIIPQETSPQSEALLLGISFAEENIRNFRLGQELPEVEVLIRDSGLDPATGKQLAENLVREGVNAIYSSHTVVTQEVTGVSIENKTPLFYDSCNCGFAEENSLAFQMYFDPRTECREVSEDFKARGVERAGFIGQDVPYGKFCYGEVQRVFGEENVEIELESGPGIVNYGSLLSRWRDNGVGVVFSIPTVMDFAFLFERNYSRGVNLPIACFEGVCLTEKIRERVAPEALENVVGFGFEIEKNFEEKILAENPEFAREDTVAAAVSHDAIVHAWYLVSQCGNDAACMQEVSQNDNYPPTAVKSSGFGEDNILIYESRR
jgi:ABC-type branched-subunit amino acid transport system substrate-binding protein